MQQHNRTARADIIAAHWLGYQDSNLEWLNQNQLCCQLHHTPLGTHNSWSEPTMPGFQTTLCRLPKIPLCPVAGLAQPMQAALPAKQFQ